MSRLIRTFARTSRARPVAWILIIELALLGVSRKDPATGESMEGDGSGADSIGRNRPSKTLLNLSLDSETHEALLERRRRSLLDALSLLVYEDRKGADL